jgi:mitochondrial fission protein ELM1
MLTPRLSDTMEEARTLVAGATCWILSDGKAGDEVQCLGVAEALGLAPEIRRVAPRAPFAWAMPWGGIDPREAPQRPGSPLAGALPDIAIASGRRTVPYLRKLKALSSGRTFTVFLKDPRIGTRAADFIWVPEHDRLRGDNVLATLTSPHRISPQRIDEAAARPPHGIGDLAHPRVAVLIGGDSRHHTFTPQDIDAFAASLRSLAASNVRLIATASRRTPQALAQHCRAIVQASGGIFWDGTGENPYIAMLALSDAVVVTADSVNMVGEAVATGRPVLVFEPGGGTAKITAFLSGLSSLGAIRPFTGSLPTYTYPPIDATPRIAEVLARRYASFRTNRKTP